MKKWVNKHSLLCKIGVKGREKDISNLGHPLKDILKKDAATPLHFCPQKQAAYKQTHHGEKNPPRKW
jgi:hypothetical protein